MRHAEHPGAAASAPAAAAAPAAASPESPPDSAQSENPPAGTTAESRPAVAPAEKSAEQSAEPSGEKAADKSADTAAAQPPCSCMDQKSKAKRRHRSKSVRKEAPPQLPTAPTVADTPPGGVVDAHVERMNVAVMSILGKRVKGAKGEDLGRVVDVLADASGRVRIAVIDFGGFLGVGNHRIAVDWPLLRFNPDDNDPSLLLSLSPEKLRTAPEYKDNPRPQTLMEVTPPVPTTAPTAAAAPADVKK
jgi:hypothetical protein